MKMREELDALRTNAPFVFTAKLVNTGASTAAARTSHPSKPHKAWADRLIRRLAAGGRPNWTVA